MQPQFESAIQLLGTRIEIQPKKHARSVRAIVNFPDEELAAMHGAGPRVSAIDPGPEPLKIRRHFAIDHRMNQRGGIEVKLLDGNFQNGTGEALRRLLAECAVDIREVAAIETVKIRPVGRIV